MDFIENQEEMAEQEWLVTTHSVVLVESGSLGGS